MKGLHGYRHLTTHTTKTAAKKQAAEERRHGYNARVQRITRPSFAGGRNRRVLYRVWIKKAARRKP